MCATCVLHVCYCVLHVCYCVLQATDLLIGGSESGDRLFMIRSGTLSVTLPRAKRLGVEASEEQKSRDSAEIPPRVVLLKAGDMLNPAALAWFTSIKRKAQRGARNRSGASSNGDGGGDGGGDQLDSMSSTGKHVSWAELPSEVEYMQAGHDERTTLRSVGANRATAAVLDPVLDPLKIIEFPANELFEVAPEVRLEADRCIQSKILRLTEAFESLKPEEIDDLLTRLRGKIVHIPSGTVVSQPSSSGSRATYGASEGGHMYIVLDGGLRVWKPGKIDRENILTTVVSEDGEQLKGERDELSVARARRGMTIGMLSPGDQFLATALISPDAPRHFTITALADTSCLMMDTPSLGPAFDQVKHALIREENVRGLGAARYTVQLASLKLGAIIQRGKFGSVVQLALDPIADTSLFVKTTPKASMTVRTVKMPPTTAKKKKAAPKPTVLVRFVPRLIDEPSVLSACKHPGVVHLFAAYQDPENLYLITEGVLGGPLSSVQQGGAFSGDSVRFYGANAVCTLAYLHSLDILYRDLTIDNLLLGTDGYLKLADFGNAKILGRQQGGSAESHTFTFCGSADYMCPEMILEHPHSYPCDLWALGVLLYVMLTGTKPFESAPAAASAAHAYEVSAAPGAAADAAQPAAEAALSKDDEAYDDDAMTYAQLVAFANDERSLEFPPFSADAVPAHTKELLVSLLHVVPDERPTATSIKGHGFFSGVDFEGMDNRMVRPPHIPNVTSSLDASHYPTKEPSLPSSGASEIEVYSESFPLYEYLDGSVIA